MPGHQGGQFYRKSPAGQLFFKHFGESIFRNDLCNADVDLGDLLIHEGPAVEAQRHAAQVFGADKTYFVLNGTSTSNKVVTNAVLRQGDQRLCDGRSQQACAAYAWDQSQDRRVSGLRRAATVVANYLREQRVVPEKCDLNSMLFLMTPAEDESKLNTLIAKLVKFKNPWDRDAPLPEVLPTVCAAHSARYAGYTLRQICNEMHDFYRQANVKELQRLCFRASSFPELAITPEDAYEALVANEVDYVPLKNHGRISATLALIYPPGIGVIVPGERWDERRSPCWITSSLSRNPSIASPASTTRYRASIRSGKRPHQVSHLRRSRMILRDEDIA